MIRTYDRDCLFAQFIKVEIPRHEEAGEVAPAYAIGRLAPDVDPTIPIDKGDVEIGWQDNRKCANIIQHARIFQRHEPIEHRQPCALSGVERDLILCAAEAHAATPSTDQC